MHEYTLPTPSWSERKKTRSPIQHGLARLPPSWMSRRYSPEPSESTHRSPTRPPRYRFHRAGSLTTRPSTTAPPGPYPIELAWPSGNRSGRPPSTLTRYSQRSWKKGRSASVA